MPTKTELAIVVALVGVAGLTGMTMYDERVQNVKAAVATADKIAARQNPVTKKIASCMTQQVAGLDAPQVVVRYNGDTAIPASVVVQKDVIPLQDDAWLWKNGTVTGTRSSVEFFVGTDAVRAQAAKFIGSDENRARATITLNQAEAVTRPVHPGYEATLQKAAQACVAQSAQPQHS